MADMKRRRMAGGQTQEFKKPKFEQQAVEAESDDEGLTEFPCHFCSVVFVTEISLNRHVLTFHEGEEVETKQEYSDENEIVDEDQDAYQNYEEPEINMNPEDESGYYVNEEGYYYLPEEEENGSIDQDSIDTSEVKLHTPEETNESSFEFSINGAASSASTRSAAAVQKSFKPKLTNEDIATVLAKVEEITSTSTSEFVTCPLCHKTFGRKELSIHIACEHGGAKFTCPYCGRNISRRDHLKRHIKNVHPDMCTETEIGPFPRNLNLCRASNAQKKLVTSANQVVQSQQKEFIPASKPLPISIVTPRITVEEEDDEEDDFEGEEDFGLQNGQDESSMYSQDSSQDSMQITVEPDLPFHLNDMDYSNYSEEDYSTPSYLMDSLQQFQDQGHVGTSMTSQSSSNAHNSPFRCSLCNAGFSSKALLDRHEATHSELRPHKCSVCGKGFLRKEHLSKHLSSVHSGMKFTCEFCGKDISRKDHLIRHIRNVHPTQFYSLPQEMEEELVTQSQQQQHQLPLSFKTAQSLQPKPKKPFFNCDMCEATFVNVDDLHSHQATVHSDVRKYKCNYCCKAFKRKEHLTKHEVLHTGERKFACRVCGNEFQRKDALQEHIRRIHGIDNSNRATTTTTTMRPTPTIPCNLCDQKFQDRGSLLSHMTTAHGLIVNSPPGLPKSSQQPQQRFMKPSQIQSKTTNVKAPSPKPVGSISANNLGSLMDLINKGSITLSFHPVKSEGN